MNIEIFIAFLGLLIGFYSVAPEILKSRVYAFVSPYVFKIFIVFYVLVALGVLYFEHYSANAMTTEILFWIKYLSYCGIFLLSWFIYASLRDRKLSRSNIARFYEYLKTLLIRQQYPILIDMVHGSLRYILPFYDIKSVLEKIRELDSPIKKENGVITIDVCRLDQRPYPLEMEITRKIFRDIIFNESFIKANVHYGKQFSTDLLRGCQKNNIRVNDYFDIFLYELLSNQDSFLYQEIRETFVQYSSDNDELDRYPFLHALFHDINYFDAQGFYRGIGEYVIEFVDKNIGSNNEKYNRSINYYCNQNERDGKYKCPIYMALGYFKHMVDKGIHDNIRSHMWLLYLHYWVKSICGKMVFIPEEWQNGREFPTVYYYLLYEILTAHDDWIRSIYEISSKEQLGTSFQQSGKSIDISPERQFIIEWILKDMLYCADSIAQCAAIPRDKRIYLLEVFMHVNVGIKSNFSQYGKARIAQATNLNKAIDVYLNEFKERIKSKNYSRTFNFDLHELCQQALNSMDTIPLDHDVVKFWTDWLNDYNKQ